MRNMDRLCGFVGTIPSGLAKMAPAIRMSSICLHELLVLGLFLGPAPSSVDIVQILKSYLAVSYIDAWDKSSHRSLSNELRLKVVGFSCSVTLKLTARSTFVARAVVLFALGGPAARLARWSHPAFGRFHKSLPADQLTAADLSKSELSLN